MDQDGSEHNICSNREGLCPGKEQHGASGWKKIFRHGKEPLRNKDSFHTDTLEGDLVITITARYDYKDTLLSYVLDKISHHVDTDHNASVEQDGNWSNIGVVVKSNNEQSYIGISIRIKGKK